MSRGAAQDEPPRAPSDAAAFAVRGPPRFKLEAARAPQTGTANRGPAARRQSPKPAQLIHPQASWCGPSGPVGRADGAGARLRQRGRGRADDRRRPDSPRAATFRPFLGALLSARVLIRVQPSEPLSLGPRLTRHAPIAVESLGLEEMRPRCFRAPLLSADPLVASAPPRSLSGEDALHHIRSRGVSAVSPATEPRPPLRAGGLGPPRLRRGPSSRASGARA